MFLTTIFLLTISLMFMLSTHPVSMSIFILLQTIMISLWCGMYINNFWFSYMLFLTMIGGLMILFMYMTNVASNEKFKSSKLLITLVMISMSMIPLNLFIDKFVVYFNLSSTENINLITMKYYNFPSNTLLMMMMIYLLLTMIMTVKISNIKEGALRQKY